MASATPLGSFRPAAPVARPSARVRIEGSSDLPTEFGNFRVHVFSNDRDSFEHLAMVHGEVAGASNVPTRLHSECLTGDVLGSLRCDCRAQLHSALIQTAKQPCGIVLYLRQEGRGIGLTNKIRAYRLQELGFDTVDANLALGFEADQRDYSVAAAMLRALSVQSIALMTNNPDKLAQLAAAGVTVTRRIAHEMPPNPHNRSYLETKARRSGHLIGAAAPKDDSSPEVERER